MARKVFLTALLLFFVISSFSYLYSIEPTPAQLLQEIQALKMRVVELEEVVLKQQKNVVEIGKVAHGVARQLKYEPGKGVEMPEAGLAIGADITMIVQGTPNANNAGTEEDAMFDASWSSDIEIEKRFENWGMAFLHLEAGQNDTIEPELNVFSNVNRDAFASGANVQVTEAWYEHYFFESQLDVTGGKLDYTVYFDQNEYANDETTEFLCRMFRNSPNIEFPYDNCLGFHANIRPEMLKYLEFDLGIFNADQSWDRVLDHMFYIAQVNFTPAGFIGLDEKQWFGNYRFYGWINDMQHNSLSKLGISTTDNKALNYGLGMSWDQMITDVFGIFGRFGWQRGNVALVDANGINAPTLEWSWSLGAQITGRYWNRDEDVVAVMVGQAIPSYEYLASSPSASTAEGHIETYYRWQLNEHLAISPDLQFIWYPAGVNQHSKGDDNTIFVYGGRAQIDF